MNEPQRASSAIEKDADAKPNVRKPRPRLKARAVEEPTRTNTQTQTVPPPVAPPLPSQKQPNLQQLAASAEEETEETSPFKVTRDLPPILVSFATHGILLILLALYTIAWPRTEPQTEIVIDPVQNVELANFDFQPAELETAEETVELETAAEPEIEQTAEPELVPDFNPASLEVPIAPLANLDRVLGDGGDALRKIPNLKLNATSFFGTKAKGKKFVFVVDNSNSMTGGRFETAVEELVRTVNGLSYDQKFYVMFFSDTAYDMYHPQATKTLVPATDRNKQRLDAWLYTVELCLKTSGKKALQKAIGMKPDAIFVLGDGAFTDNTTQLMRTPSNTKIPIHCVGMEVKRKGEQQLKLLAKSTKGTYRLVRVSASARKAAARKKLPRNKTRGPVWGITLPKGKKKK